MRSSDAGSGVAAPITYRSLLRNREFVGLIGSRWVSVVGDQVARVALTVLVFDRTGNALLAAIAFGATVVPGIFAPLASGFADRVPRRRVLIVGDVLRACILALMTVPKVPWAALVVLVAVVTVIDGSCESARLPLIRAILRRDRDFQAGTALDELIEQPSQVFGFVLAGLLLAAGGPRESLWIDSASFLVSATVLSLMVAHHPAADASPLSGPGGRSRRARRGFSDVRIGVEVAFAPVRRRPLLLAWIGGSVVLAPDAVVTPWSRELHSGGLSIGVLLAVQSIGLFGALPFVGRIDPEKSDQAVVALIALSLLPLVLCGCHPSFGVAVVLLAANGMGAAFTVLTRVSFMSGLGDDVAGRAYSVAGAGLCAGQGISIVATGVLAQQWGPGRAIGLVGLVASVGVALVLFFTSPADAGELVIVLPLDDETTESAAAGGASVRQSVVGEAVAVGTFIPSDVGIDRPIATAR